MFLFSIRFLVLAFLFTRIFSSIAVYLAFLGVKFIEVISFVPMFQNVGGNSVVEDVDDSLWSSMAPVKSKRRDVNRKRPTHDDGSKTSVTTHVSDHEGRPQKSASKYCKTLIFHYV